MGLFSSRGAAPTQPTFNAARLGPVLEALDINYATDDDGNHVGDWDTCRMYFEATGEQNEILGLRAYWDFRPTNDDFTRLVLTANHWNATRRWPRALIVPGEDDVRPLVAVDLVFDLEPGVSDELLRQTVMCFVSTSLDFFDHLANEFPEHTGWFNMGAEAPQE